MSVWTNNKADVVDLSNVSKEKMKSFYNAELLLESINKKEDSDGKYRKIVARWNETVSNLD